MHSVDFGIGLVPVILLAAGLAGASAQGTVASSEPRGAINGQLAGDTGTPLPGAQVLYNRVPDAHLGTDGRWVFTGPSVRGTVTADQYGSFRIEKLVPGVYMLCAAGPRPEHLMSCGWGEHYRRVELKPSRDVTGVVMVVPTGVLLRFRISDPAARLGKPGQRIGVRSSKGIFRPAAPLAKVGGVVEHRVAVPKRGRFEFFVQGSLTLADAGGRILPVGEPAFSIDSGEGPERMIELVAR